MLLRLAPWNFATSFLHRNRTKSIDMIEMSTDSLFWKICQTVWPCVKSSLFPKSIQPQHHGLALPSLKRISHLSFYLKMHMCPVNVCVERSRIKIRSLTRFETWQIFSHERRTSVHNPQWDQRLVRAGGLIALIPKSPKIRSLCGGRLVLPSHVCSKSNSRLLDASTSFPLSKLFSSSAMYEFGLSAEKIAA